LQKRGFFIFKENIGQQHLRERVRQSSNQTHPLTQVLLTFFLYASVV
jgi:hypothetical protein